MNPRVQEQVDQLRQIAAATKSKRSVVSSVDTEKTDGLSAAIHTKKDAVNFMAELNKVIEQAQ